MATLISRLVLTRLLATTLLAVPAMMATAPLALAAETSSTRRQVETTAHKLALALGELAEDALDAADRADDNGNTGRAEKLFDVAQAAKSLSNKVTGQIVRPLQRGGTLAAAKTQLGRLKLSFERLDDAVLELNNVPGALAQDLLDAKRLTRKLKTLLDAGSRDDGRIVL